MDQTSFVIRCLLNSNMKVNDEYKSMALCTSTPKGMIDCRMKSNYEIDLIRELTRTNGLSESNQDIVRTFKIEVN